MTDNCLLPSGDRYVAVFRSGIPMVIRFRELQCGDTLLLNNKNNKTHNEVTVSWHNARESGSEWFIHDQNWNAIFADDCDKVCQFSCGDEADFMLRGRILVINEVLSQTDADQAMAVFRSYGATETDLRNAGFGFLLDMGVLKEVSQ